MKSSQQTRKLSPMTQISQSSFLSDCSSLDSYFFFTWNVHQKGMTHRDLPAETFCSVRKHREVWPWRLWQYTLWILRNINIEPDGRTLLHFVSWRETTKTYFVHYCKLELFGSSLKSIRCSGPGTNFARKGEWTESTSSCPCHTGVLRHFKIFLHRPWQKPLSTCAIFRQVQARPTKDQIYGLAKSLPVTMRQKTNFTRTPFPKRRGRLQRFRGAFDQEIPRMEPTRGLENFETSASLKTIDFLRLSHLLCKTSLKRRITWLSWSGLRVNRFREKTYFQKVFLKKNPKVQYLWRKNPH